MIGRPRLSSESFIINMRSKLSGRNVLKMRNTKVKFSAIKGNSKINIIIGRNKRNETKNRGKLKLTLLMSLMENNLV